MINKKISKWKSTGVLNIPDYYSMNSIKNTKNEAPILKNNEKIYVYLKGSHFQQNNVLNTNNDHVINDSVINIYIVYKLDPIAKSRDTTTIQNALFGAMQITKNADMVKDMAYVLMEEKNLHTFEKEAILMMLQWLET